MIKNRAGLVEKSSFPKQAGQALQIIEAGFEAIDVRRAVKEARLPSLENFEKVYVLGFGKASAEMAEAMEKRLGKGVAGGAVVSVRKAETKRVRSFAGTHPIPSQKNLKAAREILSVAEKAGSKDLVIALVSGGGSALLALPAKRVSLRDLQRTTRLMVKTSMPVQEINVVRKHLSAVKGGRLAEAVYPASLHALVVSDVAGNRLETIASGPTVADKSTFREAVSVMKKRGLWEKVPESVRERLTQGKAGKAAETPKPGSRAFRKARNKIILSNNVATEAMQQRAKALGWNAAVYSNSLQGEARERGKRLVAAARKKKKPLALIAGGETTVEVKGKGKGGRNQEMVLGALEALQEAEKAVFVSLGSDGIDGNSRAAGAIADSGTLQRAGAKKLDWGKFLERNDSNSFFRKAGGEILTGATGTNVMDLQLLLAWD